MSYGEKESHVFIATATKGAEKERAIEKIASHLLFLCPGNENLVL